MGQLPPLAENLKTIMNNDTQRRDGRSGDIQQLEQALKHPNSDIRRGAREACARIRNEDGKIKAMREALVRETRKGNVGNIKDIHEHVKKHQDIYLNK